jgi:hypothetical protein
MIRRAFVVVALAAVAGCRQRKVEVRTAPAPTGPQQVATVVQVNSTLTATVNVYFTINGTDTFLGQVTGNSSVKLPVQGVAVGTPVTLKAVTIDGARTYSRANVTLSGTVVFPLP